MKKISKLIASCVAIVMIFQCSSALAMGINEQMMAEQSQKSADILKSNKSLYNIQTEFEGITKSYDGNYAIEIQLPGESVSGYQPAGRLDINLTDINAVDAALMRDDLTVDIKAQIEQKSREAIEKSKANQIMTVFSPTLLSDDPNQVQLYTYRGFEMMSVRSYVANNDTQYVTISEGNKAKAAAEALFDLIVMGVTAADPLLGIAANSMSVFQMFLNIASADVVIASAKDYVQVLIRYDLTTQMTYTKVGTDWSLGLTTYRVYVTTTDVRQKYYNIDGIMTTGVEEEYSNSHYVTLDSLYYHDPWATAFEFIGAPINAYVRVKAGSKTIILS